MMGDIQRVDEPLPPSYMRVIRSRHQDLDQGHHMSARGMSGASKGVGGYGSSSEVRNYVHLLHPLRRPYFDRPPTILQR